VTAQITEGVAAAQRQVWPLVKEAIDRTNRFIMEVADISEAAFIDMERRISEGTRAPDKRRRMVEQTVWTLAQIGWLRLGGEREVIHAAREWSRLDQRAPDSVWEAAEDRLIKAVSALPDYQS
jgi:hypothetical protein